MHRNIIFYRVLNSKIIYAWHQAKKGCITHIKPIVVTWKSNGRFLAISVFKTYLNISKLILLKMLVKILKTNLKPEHLTVGFLPFLYLKHI